jgi:hypothetical protein
MGQGDPGGQHQAGMTRTRWHAAPPPRGKREMGGETRPRRPNPAFHRALAICPPQLGASLGFRTIQGCPKHLPVPSGAS